MIETKNLPLLLSKKHLIDMGLSEFQFYQLNKDPVLSVQVGAKRFIHRDRLMKHLAMEGGDMK